MIFPATLAATLGRETHQSRVAPDGFKQMRKRGFTKRSYKDFPKLV